MDIQSIVDLARSTPNRGNVHIFLGAPAADLCDVTTVEPGNTFSPGVWTCGVSLALAVGEEIILPDRLSAEAIEWGFSDHDGCPPVVCARYSVGPVGVSHELCHLGADGAEGGDFNRVTLSTNEDVILTVCILVKETGPAGGVIRDMKWQEDEQILLVNGTLRLVNEMPRMAGQVFVLHEMGEGEPLAVLSADLALRSGEPVVLRFKTEHGFDNRWFTAEIPKKQPFASISVDRAFIEVREQWDRELPARVFASDPRIARVWEACAYHILAAMELNLPRIGAVNYPIFWIRDGIIILKALDLLGRSDLARVGNDYLAPLDYSGGFGAESDAPGEGIWALTQHARFCRDFAWLRENFQNIRRRVRWLERMLNATESLRAMTENRTASSYNTPASTILCLPSCNGTIHGRMDGHSPDFYINCWALAGFQGAAWAAEQLGEAETASAWTTNAKILEKAIADHLVPGYGNERDSVVAPYPTGAFEIGPARNFVKEHFIHWYRTNRLDKNGKRKREPLWTYFEAAQIHNAILFGFREEAWECLKGMLEDACSPWNISAWIEGPPGHGEQLPYANHQGARGWLQKDRSIGGNMPHNWTSGEMLALLRTIFIREEDGKVVLGKGIPQDWLKPGNRFGVKDMPTEYGPVSYLAEISSDGQIKLEYHGPENYHVGW